MTQLKTIAIPCEKNKTRKLTGTVAILPIGTRKVRFLIERRDDGSLGSLTHYASGFAFARSLNRFAVSFLVQHGTYARRPSPRELAEAAIADAVHALGADKVLAIIDAAPVINR
jgi:hypothetical protein